MNHAGVRGARAVAVPTAFAVVAAVGLAAIVGLAWLMLHWASAPDHEPVRLLPQASAVPVPAGAGGALPKRVTAGASAPFPAVDRVSRIQAPAFPPDPVPPLPYRFIGRTAVDGEAELVFFGRGRTIMLKDPGALDEAYTVEAIFDDRVLVRHGPTSAAQFVPLVVRAQQAAPAVAPDSLPRD